MQQAGIKALEQFSLENEIITLINLTNYNYEDVMYMQDAIALKLIASNAANQQFQNKFNSIMKAKNTPKN